MRTTIAFAEDTATARTIAEILEILSDGQWHLLEEIKQKMSLNNNQIQQITEFLKEYKFIAVDESRKEMRLEKAVKKFLT